MRRQKTKSERYNDRMAKIYEDCRQLERERLERGEMPNPNLTDPETARRYGWEIVGRDVKKLAPAISAPSSPAETLNQIEDFLVNKLFLLTTTVQGIPTPWIC